MITIRNANERGRTSIGWLDSRHSFSFGRYFDPQHTGFGPLLVINDDRVAPGGGFPEHPHRDMEIVSYVVEGHLAHKDSTGTERTLGPGGVQRMSAGSGIRHSEYNGSDSEPVRFLQIWITPERNGIDPGYEDTQHDPADFRGGFTTIASRDHGGSKIHQDATIDAAILAPGSTVERATNGRNAWVQVVRGGLSLNGHELTEGDGAAVTGEDTLTFTTSGDEAEVLYFDLPSA